MDGSPQSKDFRSCFWLFVPGGKVHTRFRVGFGIAAMAARSLAFGAGGFSSRFSTKRLSRSDRTIRSNSSITALASRKAGCRTRVLGINGTENRVKVTRIVQFLVPVSLPLDRRGVPSFSPIQDSRSAKGCKTALAQTKVIEQQPSDKSWLRVR